MFKAYGSYSHIRKNRLKSLFLLAAFVLLIHAVLLSLVLIFEAFTYGGTVEEIWAAGLSACASHGRSASLAAWSGS